MPAPNGHSASAAHADLSADLSATEALALVLRKLETVEATVARQSIEIDRLRRRIRDPLSERLNKSDVADDLGVHTKTVQTYAARWRAGDVGGLRGYYDVAGRWYTTRADLEAFKRETKSV